MDIIKLKRHHSHEYSCKIGDENFRFTKMANCQNWDIEIHDESTLSEFRYEITFSTLRECKDYLSDIYKVDVQ